MRDDVSRRGFLSGLAAALAAPYVVRSGILMPVKAIVRPRVLSYVEGSMDGENWTRIVRYAGRPSILRLSEFPLERPYREYRTIVERVWRAPDQAKPAWSAIARYGPKEARIVV